MRALRILMPVGMAIDILDNADMSAFAAAAGAVQCLPDQLQAPDCQVYFLKEAPEAMRVRDVQSKVHCKTLELPLNFHQVMVRCQFRAPPKAGLTWEQLLKKGKRYIRKWIALILAEKRRQMHLPPEMWVPGLPWEVHRVFDMLIVLWLSKPKEGGVPGTPPRDHGNPRGSRRRT